MGQREEAGTLWLGLGLKDTTGVRWRERAGPGHAPGGAPGAAGSHTPGKGVELQGFWGLAKAGCAAVADWERRGAVGPVGSALQFGRGGEEGGFRSGEQVMGVGNTGQAGEGGQWCGYWTVLTAVTQGGDLGADVAVESENMLQNHVDVVV